MKTLFAICLIFLSMNLGVAHAGDGSAIGPFTISNPEGTSSIRLQFAGQLRTQYESLDGGPGAERTDKLFTEARRIRTTLRGDFPRHGLTFKLHLSAAPGSIELMDFQFDYRYWQAHYIRVGQYKVPFTRYRIQSFQRLTFADWSIVTRYFGAERQMGLSFHNGYEKPPTWGYAVGIFTGVNARASHAVGLAKFLGENVANPSDLADPAPRPEYHPELFAHLCYNHAGIDVSSDSDSRRGRLRFSAALSAAWDLDPAPYEDMTTRLASELLVKFRGASISAIAYAGFADYGSPYRSRTLPAQNKLLIKSGLVQGAYRFADMYEISARYAVVDFDNDLVWHALQRALGIIQQAEEDLANADDYERAAAEARLDEITAQYKNVGYVYKLEEVTVGINIYIDGHSLKWQNDIGWLLYSRSDEDRIDVVARSQLQLSF